VARRLHISNSMQARADITFRGMAASPNVERAIERWVSRLEGASDKIERCAVVVGPRGWSKTVCVRVEVVIPERTIEVTRDPGVHTDDIYVTVADAFRAAFRELRQLPCAA
jgi:hypothetical protein